MKNSAGKDFLLLLVGLGMLGSGLVAFLTKVQLTTGYIFWGMMGNRGFTGAIFIPFILGIVLWVFFPNNIWPKILTWVSVVAIIVEVISMLSFRYSGDTFSTMMYLILIFVGGALTLKKLYIDSWVARKSNKDKE